MKRRSTSVKDPCENVNRLHCQDGVDPLSGFVETFWDGEKEGRIDLTEADFEDDNPQGVVRKQVEGGGNKVESRESQQHSNRGA